MIPNIVKVSDRLSCHANTSIRRWDGGWDPSIGFTTAPDGPQYLSVKVSDLGPELFVHTTVVGVASKKQRDRV